MIAAFLDANVLYPATLRGILLELGRVKAFRILWSEQVHQEWMKALKRQHPDIPPERIARLRTLMEGYVEDATVTGYEPLIETLNLPDPDDRHVLAAAIHGGANLIVTSNERDFPAAVLAPHNIEAISPDRFLLRLLEQDPPLFSPPSKPTAPTLSIHPSLKTNILRRSNAADLSLPPPRLELWQPVRKK